ncbi:MAG: MOSC domain-containing protein [Thermoleophilaceae bacterium]
MGQLLSVNVGLPREVAWEGKTVRTAIWKEPVEGPRMVRRINIDGDDQADRQGHGGEHRAVFVYQIESYRYWERELGRQDFSYGQFGENFTVEGLADDEVCIGDRYQVGEALFEVTQPRVTCFRVGIRMQEPKMPSLLVARHRPGFYLRVLQEGLVQAGDEITRIKTGEEQLSVADIDGLLYLPNRSPRNLERALRIPALSEGWKGSFRELLERREETSAAWEGFEPLRVESVERETSAVVSLRLAPASGEPVPASLPGQYLTLRLQPGGAGQAPLIRSYSLSSVADAHGFRISVKLEPDGVGSHYVQEHVHQGDLVDTAAPRGSFVLRDGERAIVLVSAGIGATPVLAMLQALARARSEREVWWLHGARNSEEHVFAREADSLLAELPNSHRIVTYSRPLPGDRPGQAFDAVGRLSMDTLAGAHIPADAEYYLCGPDAFMRAFSAELTAGGVLPERIATEIFGATSAVAPGVVPGEHHEPHLPPGAPGPGPTVSFARSHLTVAWDPSYGSLLELAEACDVPASFSCRTGVCHTCETGLVSGDVDYTTDPLEPPGEGRVLVCCSQPATEVTLDL